MVHSVSMEMSRRSVFCNIRAVCYLEQQRLDTLCHFSTALDIAISFYVYFYKLIGKKGLCSINQPITLQDFTCK